MSMEQCVELARTKIREAGFMSANQLVTSMFPVARECNIDMLSLLPHIPCEDIKTVEYANSATAEYRRKDLYYYSP